MKKEIIIIVVALVIILGGAYWLNRPKDPGLYKDFAECITNSGAKFYGAFWCPHCKAQKAEFGDAVSQLPYIECSEPDGQTQTPICQANGIEEYPTWVFPTTGTTTGVLSLQDLASTTGCTLPAGADTSSSDQGNGTVVSQ